jgi:hypothetical protein
MATEDVQAELKRYDLVGRTCAYTTDHEMERCDEDGEWVRYDDVADALATLLSTVARLTAERDAARGPKVAPK